MIKDTLRRCVFKPYLPNKGPMFTLEMSDTWQQDNRGQTIIGYILTMHTFEKPKVLLFEGSDFAGSPLHADDSDATVRSLMNFLTLRPGDTDAEYFANYTSEQLEFCEQHAEALSLEVMNRFGEE